jgi:hypothetical protein
MRKQNGIVGQLCIKAPGFRIELYFLFEVDRITKVYSFWSLCRTYVPLFITPMGPVQHLFLFVISMCTRKGKPCTKDKYFGSRNRAIYKAQRNSMELRVTPS